MKRLILILSILVLAAAAACAWLFWKGATLSPQVITMPNGVSYRFVATTYGTNHVMGTRLSGAIAKLPGPLANLVRRWAGNRLSRPWAHITASPTLCVWLEALNTNRTTASLTSVYAMLADERGVRAGQRQYVSLTLWPGTQSYLNPDFAAIPRRSRLLDCVLFYNLPGGAFQEIGRVHFPNPLWHHYPQWKPEPLPSTKAVGDLEVTLKSFGSGYSGSMESVATGNGKTVTRFRAVHPGDEPHAAFDLDFNSPRGTNEVWTLEAAELSDATGNRIRASSRTESENCHFAIAPSLWPDEDAWKLTLEIERKSGFLPDELVTLTDVPIPPVGETNQISVSNRLAGVQFKRLEFQRKADLTSSSWSTSQATCIRLEHTKIPDGYSLDLVKVSTGEGQECKVLSCSWSETSYQVYLKALPESAMSVDITYAVQHTRRVEFLVAPNPTSLDHPQRVE